MEEIIRDDKKTEFVLSQTVQNERGHSFIIRAKTVVKYQEKSWETTLKLLSSVGTSEEVQRAISKLYTTAAQYAADILKDYLGADGQLDLFGDNEGESASDAQ